MFFFFDVLNEKKGIMKESKKKVTKSRCSLVNVVSLYISMYRKNLPYVGTVLEDDRTNVVGNFDLRGCEFNGRCNPTDDE